MELYRAILRRHGPMLIISNGSERSDFVPVAYIFDKFKRIHDGVQIMKTYYPDDKSWNPKKRISETTAKKDTSYAWDYEYDDYHPFDLLNEDSKTRNEMEQIKRFGSDTHLTLTMDITVSDETICEIIEKLKPYGRVYLRINHECNGFWFRHNTQHSYDEVGEFFVRFHELVKRYAPNLRTVFSLSGDLFVQEGLVKDNNLQLSNDGMRKALSVADYWSIDKYASLNYGWPFYKTADRDARYWGGSVHQWWQLVEETYLKMICHNGMIAKPLFINEFNSDADVDGEDGQAEVISSIYNRIGMGEFEWLAGITLYQFRDYGGLGLENGNLDAAEPRPALSAYRQAITKFRYRIECDDTPWKREDFTFRWDNSERIIGIKIEGLGDLNTFSNRFDFPVFVIHGDEQVWRRIGTSEKMDLQKISELFLAVPPQKRDNGGYRLGVTEKKIENRFEGMFSK